MCVLHGWTREIIAHSHTACVVSGTATVETALFGTPSVIAYKTNPLTYWIAKRVVRVPYIGMVNILAGERIVNELIQKQMTPENLAQEMESLIYDNAYRNTMITLALSGLWHGAAWNFVLWGVLQGVMLCIQRAIVQIRRALGWYHPDRPLPVWRLCAGILFFFVLTCYAKMIFRARSVEQIVDYTWILFTQFGDFSLSISRPTLAALVGIPLLFLYDLQQYRTDDPQWYLSMPPSVRGLQYASVVFILLLGLSNAPAQFIYFQF